MASTQNWETPQWIIDRFGPYDLDVAAEDHNKKAQLWLGPGSPHNGKSWGCVAATARPYEGHRSIWCNPPYSGRPRILDWVKTALEEIQGFRSRSGGYTLRVDMLLPVYPCSEWFQIACKSGEIWFFDKRINFILPGPEKKKGGSDYDNVFIRFGLGRTGFMGYIETPKEKT